MGCRVTLLGCVEWVWQSGLGWGQVAGGALLFLLRCRAVFLFFAPVNI